MCLNDSWHGLLLLDCNDRVRLPPNYPCNFHSEEETSLHGPNSHPRRGLMSSANFQGSPYHDEFAQELLSAGLRSEDSINEG